MVLSVFGVVSYTFAETNIIQNANLNQANPSNATLPNLWAKGNWGTNTSVFTYPATSTDGTRAVKIAVTAYTNGDAKWYFQPVNTTANTKYHFTATYTSNVATGVVAQFTLVGGGVTYLDLGNAPIAATWSTIDRTFTTPINTQSTTIFILLNRVGTLSTDNYFLSVSGSSTSTPPAATSTPVVVITSPCLLYTSPSPRD